MRLKGAQLEDGVRGVLVHSTAGEDDDVMETDVKCGGCRTGGPMTDDR